MNTKVTPFFFLFCQCYRASHPVFWSRGSDMSPGCYMFLIKTAQTRWNTNIPRDTKSPLKAFTHWIYTVWTNAIEPVMTCVWNGHHISHDNINNNDWLTQFLMPHVAKSAEAHNLSRNPQLCDSRLKPYFTSYLSLSLQGCSDVFLSRSYWKVFCFCIFCLVHFVLQSVHRESTQSKFSFRFSKKKTISLA